MIMVAIGMYACLCSGCVILPKGDSEAGVRTTNSVEFFHRAPDEGAEFRVDVLPWVQEEIRANHKQAAVLEQIKAAAEAKAASDGS